MKKLKKISLLKRVSIFSGVLALFGAFVLCLFSTFKQYHNKVQSVSAVSVNLGSRVVEINHNYTSTNLHSCTLSIVGSLDVTSDSAQFDDMPNLHYWITLNANITITDRTNSNVYYLGSVSSLGDFAVSYDILNQGLYFGCNAITRSNSKTNIGLGLSIYGERNGVPVLLTQTNFTLIGLPNSSSNVVVVFSQDGDYIPFDNTLYTFDVESYDGGYNQGYAEGYLAGQSSGYDNGYSAGYNTGLAEGNASGYNTGYNTGLSEGSATGYSTGYTEGFNEGSANGYDDGFADGVSEAEQNYSYYYDIGYSSGYSEGSSQSSTATTIFSGILQVSLVPINFFLSIFNFEILGINLSAFIRAIFTVVLTIIVIKTVLGKGGGGSDN